MATTQALAQDKLPKQPIDPRAIKNDTFVAAFLDGFNSQKGIMWKERREADALAFGSFGRFFAHQDIDVACVVEGMRRAGWVVEEGGNIRFANELDPVGFGSDNASDEDSN